MSKAIRILLADDHMVVRAGLSQVIGAEPDMEVVGEAASGEEALHLCERLKPDIVLMDVRMRGMGGIAATEAIGKYHTGTWVIGLSTYSDTAMVTQIIEAGARGFLPKSVSAEALTDTIRRVFGGEIVREEVSEPSADPQVSGALPGFELGAQQRRVLALLTKGCTNQEIAGYLNITLPTARYHVSAILVKLGVSNRAEAAAVAVRSGLIAPSDF